MIETELNLTEQERGALREISERTGKSEAELIHGALARLIREFQKDDDRSRLLRARGIWKDRDDLPALEDLRREWERS